MKNRLNRPYYQDEWVTIYHGDCREILPELPKVDLVLTDPPYGLNEKWNGGAGTSRSTWRFKPEEAKIWDTEVMPIVTTLPQYAQFAIIWGGNYYSLPPTRSWLIWDKKMNDNWSTGQAELAWSNIDRPIRIFRLSQVEAHTEMIRKCHPTQKPASLILWCIKMARDSNGVILDPFLGSGTTAYCAKKLNRKCIGIEIEEKYCEIAAKRCSQGVFDLR